MQRISTPLLNRPDTLLGVCEGLGQDFGVHPNIFRLALVALLFWNPELALGIYAVLGAVVYFFRWAMPDRKLTEAEAAQVTEAEPEVGNDDDRVPETVAA